jgi:two-component system cell cycle sensor histidine kinase/response regulator CckA
MIPRKQDPMASRVPTILVVDDTDVVRKSVARCLRRRGYLVLEASSADEALALLATNGNQLDLVLADLVLPTMSGVELIAEVQRCFPAMGFAYMTGHFGSSARFESSFKVGTEVLVKPFTPSSLEQRVRTALIQSGWNTPIDSALELIGPNDSGGYGTH